MTSVCKNGREEIVCLCKTKTLPPCLSPLRPSPCLSPLRPFPCLPPLRPPPSFSSLTTNSSTGAVKESHSQYKHAVLHTHTVALMQWEGVRLNMQEVAIFDSIASNLQFPYPVFALHVRLHGEQNLSKTRAHLVSSLWPLSSSRLGHTIGTWQSNRN